MMGGKAQEGEQQPTAPPQTLAGPATAHVLLSRSLGQSKSYVHLLRQGPASPRDCAGEAGKGL